MAEHLEVGKEGEELAANWLQQNGYEILHRNWRHSHYEIDIIASKENILHIIEVKLRRFSPNPLVEIWVKLEFLNPSSSIKDRIVRHIIQVAFLAWVQLQN